MYFEISVYLACYAFPKFLVMKPHIGMDFDTCGSNKSLYSIVRREVTFLH